MLANGEPRLPNLVKSERSGDISKASSLSPKRAWHVGERVPQCAARNPCVNVAASVALATRVSGSLWLRSALAQSCCTVLAIGRSAVSCTRKGGDQVVDSFIPMVEGRMAENAGGITVGARRNEDIALDMMKFIALTTGYGKVGAPTAGFQGSAAGHADEYATHLLELYGRCLGAVSGKK
jgi:hypothetical protein